MAFLYDPPVESLFKVICIFCFVENSGVKSESDRSLCVSNSRMNCNDKVKVQTI